MNNTFRRLAITVLAAFAATFATFAASPAATEAWVTNYVSTVAAGSSSSAKVAPVSASITVDGTNYTYSFTMYFANEPTWKISESTVTGMVAGTHFALDAYGNACNYTNAACDTIYQSVSTNWTFVKKAWSTAGTRVFVTNRRDVVQLDFKVNGVDFRGYEDYRHHTVIAAGVSNQTGIIKFRRSYVTPTVKTKLLTQPAQVSWWNLFIGTAYAGWELGEWDDGTAVDGGTLYRAHYRWDGESLAVDIPSVSVEGSAGTVHFQTGTAYEIEASCDDYCEKTEISSSDVMEDIKSTILDDAEGVMGEVQYKNFERLMNLGRFDSQIKEAIDTALEPYNATVDCPEEETIPDPDDDEEEPEDPPKPPSPNTCAHPNAYCNSSSSICQFRCAVCQKIVQSYESHHFADSSDHCAVCDRTYTDNSGKTHTCGVHSNEKSHHIFSKDGVKFGGDATGCKCMHGTIWEPHGTTTYVTVQWEYDTANHWKLKECEICGYAQIKADMGGHFLLPSAPYYYPDRCETSNICYTCKYAELGEVVGHVNSGDEFSKFLDHEYHTNMYYCAKCSRAVGLDKSSHHDDGTKAECIDRGDTGHTITRHCDECDHDYIATIEPHSYTGTGKYETASDLRHHYEQLICKSNGCYHPKLSTDAIRCTSLPYGPLAIHLVDDVNEMDWYSCRYCTNGHGTEVSHTWRITPEKHWCANGVDITHLEGEHVFVDNICTVCGYNRGDAGAGGTLLEYEERTVNITCSSHCCNGGVVVYHRVFSTNGVVIAENKRGDWIYGDINLGKATCKFLDGSDCRCPYCRGETTGLEYNECYCPHINDGDLICITTSHVMQDYYRHYCGSSARIINFNDPVYEIDSYCFLEAFCSMPKLTMAKMATVTNVAAGAFMYGFTNSTALAYVDFSALETTGVSAFHGAFRGCPLNGRVDFSALTSCGTECFQGAFAETSIGGIGLDSLLSSGGTLDFFGGAANASVKSLSAPKLADVGAGPAFVFADMPNLTTINLASVSTNVFNVIGDLSPLDKLQRMDLHAMTAVPNFYQTGGRHTPTNAPNLMVVVPDGLWAEWVDAPGWSTIAGNIVPYSNQVIRTRITVAFDTDYGEPVASTNIYPGQGVYPPATLTKYAASYGGGDDGAFTFEGWYTNAAKTVRYTSGTPIWTNATLYAKWTDNRQIVCSSSTAACRYNPPDEPELWFQNNFQFDSVKLGHNWTQASSYTDTWLEFGYSDGTIVRESGEGRALYCAGNMGYVQACYVSPGSIGAPSSNLPTKVRLVAVCPDETEVASGWMTITYSN